MSRHFKKINNIVFRSGYSKSEVKKVLEEIFSYQNEDMIAFYNPECIGVMHSTKDMFKNTIALKEVFSEKVADKIAETIINCSISQVVFSSITFGWKRIAEILHEKNPDIKIKFFWHGAHAMLVQRDEPYFLYSIMELLDRKIAYSIGFAKESMAEFYIKKGYNAYFVPNTVKNISSNVEKIKSDKIVVGLYSAGSRWEKNTFNQLSAISLIPNAIVDIAPESKLTTNFCNLMNIEIKEKNLKYMPRQKLLDRMAKNDVNMYVTFTECSPVLPLESLELGVPCVTGNNHHYFKGSKLYDYLVVKSEDDINEIANKANEAVKNKDEIISLYKEWKKDYDVFVEEKLKEFING